MAQNISDRLERRSTPEQVNGERVSKAMRALERDFQSTFADKGLKGFSNRSGLQQTDRRPHAQKYSAAGSHGRSSP
jgi:hypothetical protein